MCQNTIIGLPIGLAIALPTGLPTGLPSESLPVVNVGVNGFVRMPFSFRITSTWVWTTLCVCVCVPFVFRNVGVNNFVCIPFSFRICVGSFDPRSCKFPDRIETLLHWEPYSSTRARRIELANFLGGKADRRCALAEHSIASPNPLETSKVSQCTGTKLLDKFRFKTDLNSVWTFWIVSTNCYQVIR